jgi:hypothetical protein
MWVHTYTVTAYRNALTLQVTDTIPSYDLNFHPVPHSVTVSCERYTMGFPVCYESQKHHECKESERSGLRRRVTFQIQICSGRNRVIPLMRRPNSGSTPNMPVTLPRNQLLIRYVVTCPVHTVTTRCYGTRKRYKCVPTLWTLHSPDLTRCYFLLVMKVKDKVYNNNIHREISAASENCRE